MHGVIEIFTRREEIIKAIRRFQANIKKFWGAYVDSSVPSFSTGEVKQGYMDAKKRGVNIIYITEITKENIKYCREIADYAQLRHIAGIKGAFALSDTEYIVGIKQGDELISLLRTNINELVRQQRYIFDKLWELALPASERIREIP